MIDGVFAVAAFWFALVVFVGIKSAVRALGVNNGSQSRNAA